MELDNLSTQEKNQLEKLISKTREQQQSRKPEEVRLSVIPESKTKTESQLKNQRRIKNLEESVTILAEVMTDLAEREGLNTEEKTVEEQETENEPESSESIPLSTSAYKVYQELSEQYRSSKDIAEDVGLHPTTVRNTLPELKEKDLVETKLGVGTRKKPGKEVHKKESEGQVTCEICGNTFKNQGFTQHVMRVENIDFKSFFEKEDGVFRSDEHGIERESWASFKAALNKGKGHPSLTHLVADKLLEIKESQENKKSDSEEDESDFQAVMDDLPDSEVDRIDLLRQLSSNFYKNMDEIADASGQPEVTSSYYLKPFEKHDLVTMKRRAGTMITEKGREFLEWVDESQEENEESEDNEDEEVEPDTSSESSDLTREELLDKVNVSDHDFDVATLAFEKILNREEKDFVSYHLFEQHFEGDNVRPIRFFQKMFSNPAMVQHLLDAVGVDNDWTWSKKQDFKDGMKNWVIELK